MAMGPTGPETKNKCAGKSQHQMNRTEQTRPDKASQSRVSTLSQWLPVSTGVEDYSFQASKFKYPLHTKFSLCLSKTPLSAP
jgi:hypothetical protein